jgi:hypothetical protein
MGLRLQLSPKGAMLQAGEEGIELAEGFSLCRFEGFDRGYALGELLLEGEGRNFNEYCL